jgi:signal peptidase I
LDFSKNQASIKGIESWLKEIFFATLTAVLIIVFLVQPVRVEGNSMQPRLQDNERVFVNKILYRVSDIDRGDIVVFWYPGNTSKSFIKRVIGLPGDKIEIRSGQVFINNSPYSEPYIVPGFSDRSDFGPIRVPPEQYFVMGDHRSTSNDSRNWGTLSANLIFGKAVFRYWPLSRMGSID